MRTLSWMLLSLLLVGLTLPGQVQAQVSEKIKPLLKYVPDDGNSIAVLHVDYLLQTNRAQKENWSERREIVAIDAIPDWIDSLVVASSFDPFSLREDWLVALTTTEKEQFDQLTKQLDVSVHQVADRPTYLSPRDMYVAELAEGEIGAFSPPTRQEFVRWVRSATEAEQPRLSPYLADAASQNVHMAMALDLQDFFDPMLVEKWLKASKAMKDYPNRISEMTTLMQNLQGLNLRVLVSDSNKASLSVDFNQPVGRTGDLVKPVLLEILRELQFSLPDLQKSEVSIEGKSVVLNMDLYDYSLRHLISMILSPQHEPARDPLLAQAEREEQTKSPTEPSKTVTTGKDGYYEQQDAKFVASQNYLRSIISIMSDLEKLNSQATNYLNTASWHDNAANRIDRLAGRGVDQELLEYGNTLSSQLRALAASLRGVAVKVNTEAKTLTYSYGVSATDTWGGRGWGMGRGTNAIPMINWNSNIQQIKQNQAEAVQRGVEEREEIWQMIKNDHNEIKLEMREEFGDKFVEGLQPTGNDQRRRGSRSR